MSTKSATFYDLIYSFKDYAAEAETVRRVIDAANNGSGCRLLDETCGTGQHLHHLKNHFEAEGLVLDPELLTIARRRLPYLRFTHADMLDFDMGRRFDAVVCLFSSIGYVATLEKLRMTARTFTRHLEAGGVVVVESWLTPDSAQATCMRC